MKITTILQSAILRKYFLVLLILLSFSGILTAQNILSVADAQVSTGEDVTISIQLSNQEAVVAFQMDVPIPEAFSYVGGSAVINLQRSSSHQLSAILLPQNVLRIVCFSNDNSTFTGNSGEVISFVLTAGNTPGNYVLPIENAVVSNQNAVNVLNGTVNANLLLTGPALFANRNLDFGFVALETSIAKPLNLFNLGQNHLIIESTSFSNSNFSTNAVFPITIGPYSQHTITIEFLASEAGEVDATMSIFSNNPSENPYVVELSANVFSPNYITVNDLTSQPAGTAFLEISIENFDAFTAFQFDLQLPENVSYIPASALLNPLRVLDHNLVVTDLGNNLLRVLAYSLSQSPFNGNDGVMLSVGIELNLTSPYSPLPVLLSNGILANSQAQNILWGMNNGFISVTEFTINASAGENGLISPSGFVGVYYGTNQEFTIIPDNRYKIADVVVDGESIGAAATYTFTNVTQNHTIEAYFSIQTFTILATTEGNGTISPSGEVSVEYDTDLTFQIEPDPGNEIADVLVNGQSVGAVSSYTFKNVLTDHTIHVIFEKKSYTITAEAGENGKILPSGVFTFDYGMSQVFEIVPEDFYKVADVVVDGLSVGPVSSFEFQNISENHTIYATFTLMTYTIVSTADENGTITPLGKITFEHGSSQLYTIIPELHYSILDVLVDGESVGPVSSYLFQDISANHVIHASFVIDNYPINATAGSNGSINPSGEVLVDYGSDQLFNITPDPNYHILDVLVDLESVGPVDQYEFINVTEPHKIHALFTINTYSITSSAGENGTINPEGTITLPYGSDQTYTITPDFGYHVADVLIDGTSVGPMNEYTFSGIDADHTIQVIFEINTYYIFATITGNGSINPSGQIIIEHGQNQLFLITPDPNYYILDVLVDNVSVGAVEQYLFENVVSDHTIEVVFTINTFTINATAGTNGTITPSGAVVVDYGSSQLFAFIPDYGFQVADVIVDGVSVGAVEEYTFDDVVSDHSIHAEFETRVYIIAASAGENGSITPSGEVNVLHQTSQLFVITPAANYHISDVVVDGVSVGAVNQYMFENVISAHTIHALFTIDTFTIIASADINGSISPSNVVTADYGSDQTFVITPDYGFQVADVVVDGVSVGQTEVYTFVGIDSDHTIHAVFETSEYIITASAAGNGTISPSGQVIILHNESQSFSIIPDANHYILDVLVDGVSVGVMDQYIFNNVVSDHTINAVFAVNTFVINASARLNGSISPAGNVSVNYGSDITFQLIPEYGYHVLDVIVDGLSIGARDSYTFLNVTEQHTIEASFELNTYTIFAEANEFGNISPSGFVSILHGLDQLFEFTPDEEYIVSDVLINNISIGASEQYKFINIIGDQTIKVLFAPDTVFYNPEILVYPIPTLDDISIRLKHHKKPIDYDYQIFDRSGRMLITGKFNTIHNKISLALLSPGVYFLRIVNESNVLKVNTIVKL